MRKSQYLLALILLSVGLGLGHEFGQFRTQAHAGQPILSSTASQNLLLHLAFGKPEMEEVGGYSWLKLPDCHYISEPGAPALPVYTKVIKLNEGLEVSSIRLKDLIIEEMSITNKVMPAPMWVPLDGEGEGLSEPNSKIYGAAKWYPQEWFIYSTGYGLDVKSTSRVNYLSIHFYPLRYEPVEGKVKRVKSCTLDIRYRYSNRPASSPLQPNRLCIIYGEGISTQASNLEAFKDSQGWDAFIISTAEIYENYPGTDEQEKIKNFIKDETDANGTLYYILFGDSDLIPVRYAVIPRGEPDAPPYNPETDLYYAEHDLNWNADGDSNWGEVPDDIPVDALPFPDAVLGRLPASNATEAEVLVNKIINYCETSQPDKYLLLGTDPFPEEDGAELEILKDMIDDIVPPTVTTTKLYETHGNLTPSNVTQQINSGQGWVNYGGHGGTTGWALGAGSEGYIAEDVDALANGYVLPMIWTVACSTSHFAHPEYDCIGEHFLLNPNGGGIAYFGATETAWKGGFRGLTDGRALGLPDGMDYRFSYSYFVRGIHEPGPLLVDALTDYINEFGIGTVYEGFYIDWLTVAEYSTLLGDPTLCARPIYDVYLPLVSKGFRPSAILFDETHDERNTLSEERARQFNPEHPEWCYFGEFKERVSREYRLYRHDTGDLTDQYLQGYAVLILAAPDKGLSDDEIASVVRFVQGGSGLLVLGDAGLNEDINHLFNQFGIEFDPTPVASPEHDWDAQSFHVENLAPHPVTQGLEWWHTNWGGSLQVGEPALSLSWTTSDAWKDANGNGVQDLGEAVGSFTLLAAAQVGQGRVVVISDNAFHEGMFSGFNAQLMMNMLAWLSQKGH